MISSGKKHFTIKPLNSTQGLKQHCAFPYCVLLHSTTLVNPRAISNTFRHCNVVSHQPIHYNASVSLALVFPLLVQKQPPVPDKNNDVTEQRHEDAEDAEDAGMDEDVAPPSVYMVRYQSNTLMPMIFKCIFLNGKCFVQYILSIYYF